LYFYRNSRKKWQCNKCKANWHNGPHL